ncbi:hypothetical protein [Vreelandella populi]|uniref:hypothetical protein n=1 Tax=Vreelandella populi TaxID=2498858 RepID=UPI000F8EBF33|nr:hypothetical protein [Halomonas populi]RUR36665.1 hypothetical protein ELY25_13565 [Halomonas populi]
MTGQHPPNAVIPLELEREVVDQHQKSAFQSRRKSLLSEMRCLSGLPNLVSQFNQGTLYKLVMTPEGASLYRDQAGNVKGVFYKDKKIKQHAKFSEVNPNMVKAAQAVGAQVMLVSIAMQLNRIEQGISEIIGELHRDRLGELKGAIKTYEDALEMQNSENKDEQIRRSIPLLRVGLTKNLSSLANQIQKLPEEKLSFFDNWISKKSSEAKKNHVVAIESFQACLHGIQSIVQCYVHIGESKLAAKVLEECMQEIRVAGVEIAFNRSRLVPAEGNAYPEQSWKTFIENETHINNGISQLKMISSEAPMPIEIQFKGSEIMEMVDAKL